MNPILTDSSCAIKCRQFNSESCSDRQNSTIRTTIETDGELKSSQTLSETKIHIRLIHNQAWNKSNKLNINFQSQVSSLLLLTLLYMLWHWWSIKLNPLTPIGSNSTQQNSPRNFPDFAASTARFSWPARSRHTAACMHRFFHILRQPREPTVWFMSESGAVASEQARTYVDLPIISSGFETAVRVRGLTSEPMQTHLLKNLLQIKNVQSQYQSVSRYLQRFKWILDKF